MDTVRDLVETVLIAALIALVIRGFIFEPFLVDGPSMEPTLFTGEWLFVSKIAYRFGEVKRGDVIVFRYPLNPSKDYVKRCVAVAGDTVELRLGRLYVNGQLVEESQIRYPGLYNMKAVTVPEGCVFVLGDHRTNSEDSRYFGPINVRDIKGKAEFILWPLKSVRRVK